MQSKDLSSRSSPSLVLVILAALGLWSIAIPYVGPSLGLILDVPTRLEVADHAIPGVIVAASVLVSLRRPRLEAPRQAIFLTIAAGVAFLAGLWMTSTHVPLLFDAAGGLVAWGTALFHSIPGLLVMLLALQLFVRHLKALES